MGRHCHLGSILRSAGTAEEDGAKKSRGRRPYAIVKECFLPSVERTDLPELPDVL